MRSSFQSTSQNIIYIVVGISLGFLMLNVLNLPLKWAFTILAGIAFGFGIWIFGNIEKTILILLLLAIPLNLDINFFIVKGHNGGMNSISIGLVDIFLILLIAL